MRRDVEAPDAKERKGDAHGRAVSRRELMKAGALTAAGLAAGGGAMGLRSQNPEGRAAQIISSRPSRASGSASERWRGSA